ncbi:MAG: hypothetical protein ACRD2P_13040 [Terriglobia bacterium]
MILRNDGVSPAAGPVAQRLPLAATQSIVILSEAKDLLLLDGFSGKADSSLRSE